ncbi:MAG: hypothetical protein U0X41_02165 [Chitinophagales bacterium]
MNYFLFSILLVLLYSNDEVFRKASMQASQMLTSPHDETDTFISCNGKITTIILKDSVINKPGQLGMEYNYPIYKYETEIIFYKDKQLAAIEMKQISLKHYEYLGVTTGMEKSTIIDNQHCFYFDQSNRPISRLQLLEIQKKICREKEE